MARQLRCSHLHQTDPYTSLQNVSLKRDTSPTYLTIRYLCTGSESNGWIGNAKRWKICLAPNQPTTGRMFPPVTALPFNGFQMWGAEMFVRLQTTVSTSSILTFRIQICCVHTVMNAATGRDLLWICCLPRKSIIPGRESQLNVAAALHN